MIAQRLRQWQQSWLKHRIPPQKTHTFSHRNIFILPSKSGLGFVFLSFLLWLLGTNYENNLILGIAFLLLSVMLVCIHYTYANLAGLSITVTKADAGFVGEEGSVQYRIRRQAGRTHEAIQLYWDEISPTQLNLITEESVDVSITILIATRGWFTPPRLRVVTRFPLGLVRAWSTLDMDVAILAYPSPVVGSIINEQASAYPDQQLESRVITKGSEEFSGLKEYQAGDPIKHIDWRSLARGQSLATKTYEDYAGEQQWVDWQQYEGLHREERLSRMCAAVLAFADQNKLYGLVLPNITIAPDQGERHRLTVLKALALFEVP